MTMARIITVVATFAIILFSLAGARASIVEYDLTIAEQDVNITGKPVIGMTVNGTIPGPVLRFKEGDFARINVHNTMPVETSIHWHGILVPPEMDGVPYLSFPPIAPGATFTFEFPLRQSGTYWYHSHTSLQEQKGVYGAIVIEPRQDRFSPDQDQVVVLSDWTDEDPYTVLRTLKSGSEWYSIQKGSVQSILGATWAGRLGAFFKRELLRMPPMDIADVAYDRFLANGEPEHALQAAAGQKVRLRIIDGSSTTFFHLTYAGGPMTIVAADGQDVEPVAVERLLVGVAETYDLLVDVPAQGAYELRATAHDGSASASVWVGSGLRHPAAAVPKPDVYHTMAGLSLKRIFALTPAGAMGMSDREVESGLFDLSSMMRMRTKGMGAMHMDKEEMMAPQSSTMENREHHLHAEDSKETGSDDHDMITGGRIPADRGGKGFSYNFRPLGTDASSSPNRVRDGMDTLRPWPPYDRLRATTPTAFSPDRPVHRIRLTLDGDMERYVWFINNMPLSEQDYIRIRRGEVVRFILINRTMMHHPMHLHGHFFRVINEQGDYSPLKHTVDVPPMSTTVIEFDANEFGDWFFHCHLLYHMKSGMARVVHYENFILYPELAVIRPKLYRDSWYFWGGVSGMSNMAETSLTLANSRQIIHLDGEFGWQEVEDPEWEAVPTWGYSVDRFTTVFIGMNLDGEEEHLDNQRGILGLRYLLPLNIEFMSWIDTYAEFRFSAGKSFELTPRFALFGETEYDTESSWKGKAGISYLIDKKFSIIGQWHSDFGWGGGISFRF